MNENPPIPDPSVRDEFASCPTFRMRVWRPLLVCESIGLLILLTIFVLFFAHLSLGVMQQGMVFAATAGVLAMVYAFYFQSVAVHPQKLRAYSFWGTKVILEWPEIAAVRPIRIFGLLYLRLVSTNKNKKPMCAPACLLASTWRLCFRPQEPGMCRKFPTDSLYHTCPSVPVQDVDSGADSVTLLLPNGALQGANQVEVTWPGGMALIAAQ